jgi:GT2 family glycosyltransferase
MTAVIIVTHNSQLFLPKAMQALQQQTRPADQIVIVDSGSEDTRYLEPYRSLPSIKVLLAEGDIGFCRGNNIGFQHIPEQCKYVFLVNPDLFLTPDYLEKAAAYMEQPQAARWAALTGTTLGYDIQGDRPTGRYDTTGVFSTWYGRWYDRAQGEWEQPGRFAKDEEIPAICGANFFCRRAALDQVLLRGSEILDSSFYMYKEDIDLSLRLRRKGWRLQFVPDLFAYHCRGWSPDRRQMARWCRLCSARNDWRIHWSSRSPHKLLYAGLKWIAVYCLDW